jgi:AP-3 complex subunit beta
VINQLVLLAIKKAASDPSPYVRKTAAYAIPKLYRMDPVITSAIADSLVLNESWSRSVCLSCSIFFRCC